MNTITKPHRRDGQANKIIGSNPKIDYDMNSRLNTVQPPSQVITKKKKKKKTKNQFENRTENSLLQGGFFGVWALSHFIRSDHGVNHWSTCPPTLRTNYGWKLVYIPSRFAISHGTTLRTRQNDFPSDWFSSYLLPPRTSALIGFVRHFDEVEQYPLLYWRSRSVDSIVGYSVWSLSFPSPSPTPGQSHLLHTLNPLVQGLELWVKFDHTNIAKCWRLRPCIWKDSYQNRQDLK